MWILAPFRWIEKEVCGDTDENLARLRSVPAMMALAGVVSLLGGIVEVCQHVSRSFSSLVVCLRAKA